LRFHVIQYIASFFPLQKYLHFAHTCRRLHLTPECMAERGIKLGKINPNIFEIKIKIIRNGRCIKSSDRWQR